METAIFEKKLINFSVKGQNCHQISFESFYATNARLIGRYRNRYQLQAYPTRRLALLIHSGYVKQALENKWEIPVENLVKYRFYPALNLLIRLYAVERKINLDE